MSEQAVVSINDSEWQVTVVNTPWEMAQGLGGLQQLPTGTGMLFDTGYEQLIQVTTVPMLFPLDIAFFSEDFTLLEVYHDIEPGYLVDATIPSRYFLEVNGRELADIESGVTVSIEYLDSEEVLPAATDWVSVVVPFTGFLAMGAITTLVMRDIVKELFEDEKSLLLQQGNDSSSNNHSFCYMLLHTAISFPGPA